MWDKWYKKSHDIKNRMSNIQKIIQWSFTVNFTRTTVSLAEKLNIILNYEIFLK